MRLVLHFIAICLLGQIGFAQEYQHPTSWDNVGVLETYEADFPVLNFAEVKASFTGDVNDDIVIQHILRENSGGCQIFFPRGEYVFKKPIKLHSGCVLKGEYASFTFDLDHQHDCIIARGSASKDTLYYGAPLAKGQQEINASFFERVDNQWLIPGQYYLIVDEDEELAESWWARRKTGQIVMPKKVNNDLVVLLEPLRRDFGKNIRFVPLNMVYWVGVEGIEIYNKNKTEQQTSNILFQYCRDSWVKEVRSQYCNYAHFTGEFITNCEIENNEFSDAHDYGSGGKGYGVALQFASGNCLVINNEFVSLRHSMLVQAGANGNAFVRNDSEEAYWTDTRLPKNAAGDIVLHGNYPYANLFERNDCNTIVIDKSHGYNGPDNLFFENTIESYGIYCPRKSSLGPQAFINNYIKDVYRWPRCRYVVKGEHYQQFNTIRKKIKSKGSKRYDSKKSFLF